MNPIDIHRHDIRRRAAELALAGRHFAAACLYAELLAHGVRDGEIALRLGEQRRRCGDVAGARLAFQQAVVCFACEGRDEQAAATQRIVDTLRPIEQRPSWFRRLMSHFQRRSFRSA